MLEIVAPGPLCTVQDRGRPGLAHLGVGQSGAADRAAYELANRLVGNRAGAAALEITFGGLVVRFERSSLVAITGAACLTAGRDLGDQQPVAVPAGATITFAAPATGLRTYLAIRGGIAVDPVLGSMSTDLLAGLGPTPLVAGDRIAIGPDPGTTFPVDAAPRLPATDAPIGVWPGPRTAWFEPDALDALVESDSVVMPTSNRIGARLDGTPLARCVHHELPSEGLLEGAIQVPTGGHPLILLADHPTTGGYPVIAVVERDHLSRIAQARPGDRLRFQWLARPS